MAPHANLFEDLERMDTDAWAEHLAPDVVMRVASQDPVHGREACRDAAVAFGHGIAGFSHHIIEQWHHGDATIVEATVTVELRNLDTVVTPMVTIYRIGQHGLIADYRVYLDPASLQPN